MTYKCITCSLIIGDADMVDGNRCPVCENLCVEMCKNDHKCTCIDDLQYTTQRCDVCGSFVCNCGSHDCEVLSRVTGYIQALGGWNHAKVAEFNDRTRYEPLTGNIVSTVDGTPANFVQGIK